MRKILVALKRVADYSAKIKLSADGKEINTEGVKWVINPFDEIAVEEALRIKERFIGKAEVEVVVVSVGPEVATEQLRTALAMGADRAVLVVTAQQLDSHIIHQLLKEIYQREQPNLVIMGKQAVDSDNNQTGQLLAAKLKIPQATFASKVELNDDWSVATVTREVDGGLESIRVQLPAVVTTDLRLNEPRYPSLPGIVKAKKKPLDLIAAGSFNLDLSPAVEIVSVELPSKARLAVRVNSVTELVERLHKEAKVL